MITFFILSVIFCLVTCTLVDSCSFRFTIACMANDYYSDTFQTAVLI